MAEYWLELVDFKFELYAADKPVKKIVYSKNCVLPPEGETKIYNEHFYIMGDSPVDTLDSK